MAQQNSVSTKNPTYWDLCHFFKDDLNNNEIKPASMAANYSQHGELITSCGFKIGVQFFRNLRRTWRTLLTTPGADEILPEVCDYFTYSIGAASSKRPPVVNNQTFAQNLAWTKLCATKGDTEQFGHSEEGEGMRVACLKILRNCIKEEHSVKNAEGQIEWTKKAKEDPFVVTNGGDMSEVTQLLLTRREMVSKLTNQVKSSTCNYDQEMHCNEIR